MRRLLIISVLGLLVGVGLVTLIQRDAGYVFVSFGDTTVETSVWFAVLVWLLAWGLLGLAWRGLRGVFRVRSAMAGWLGSRKARNAAALTNRGLITFIEGNWARARRQLLRAARYSEAPLVNHLLAAQASFRLGDLDEMRRQLGAAESVESGAGIALELTQAEMQLSAGHYEQALATLVRARANAGKHPHVLELLAVAHRRLGDWEALRDLLPELRKHGILDLPVLDGLEPEIWTRLLDNAGRDDGEGVNGLDRIWQSIPPVQRELDALRRCYLRRLIALGAYAKAERLLVDMLDKRWDQDLVSLVGRFPPQKSERMLKIVQRWLTSQGPKPVLLLAAGRVALHAEDWNRAQEWLQDARHAEPTVESCLELARLREAQGDRNAAEDLFREAALLAAPSQTGVALPDRR